MPKYTTRFNLTEKVLDVEKANEYLQEDTMLDYLDNLELANKINSIVWELKTNRNGVITVDSKEKLTKRELKELSLFISDQNADGLGEGFSQQEFANYWSTDNDEHENRLVTSSFDWELNRYKLQIVK